MKTPNIPKLTVGKLGELAKLAEVAPSDMLSTLTGDYADRIINEITRSELFPGVRWVDVDVDYSQAQIVTPGGNTIDAELIDGDGHVVVHGRDDSVLSLTVEQARDIALYLSVAIASIDEMQARLDTTGATL